MGKDTKTLQNLPNEAAKIVRNYRRAVSATQGKKLLSADEKREHIDELTRKAQEELADRKAEGQAALKRVQAGGTKPQGSVPVQQLSETRKLRAWDRLKPLLDASSDVTGNRNGPDTLKTIQDAVADAVKTGDANTYQALQEELPSYLTAKRLDMYANIVPTLLKPGTSLAQGTGKTHTPVESEQLGGGWKRVETALSMAEHAVTDTDPASKGSSPIDRDYEIPAYDNGEVIVIEGVTSASEERDDFGRPANTAVLPQLGAD